MGTPVRIAVVLGIIALVACGVMGTLGPEGLIGAAVIGLTVWVIALIITALRRL